MTSYHYYYYHLKVTKMTRKSFIFGLTMTALATILGYTPMQAQPTVKADTEISMPTNDDSRESTTRFGVESLPWGLSAKGYLIKEKDADGNLVSQDAGGWVARTTSISDSVQNTAYIRPRQTIDDGIRKDMLNIGTDFSIKTGGVSIYTLPVWMTFDEDGLSSNLSVATVSTKPFEAGFAYEIKKDTGDAIAAYATARNDQIGIGLSKYYGDPIASVQLGYTNGKFGILAWSEHNWDKGDFYASAFVAENPTSLLSPEGISTLANVCTLGQPQEIDPYFTSPAMKTKGGAAGRLEVKKEGDVYTVTPHVAFRDDQLGLSVSQPFTQSKGQFTSGPVMFTGTYQKGPAVVELKINTDGDFGVYGGFTKEIGL